MKKLLTVLITILYCFSSLAFSVSAEETAEIKAKDIISNEYGIGFYRVNGTDMQSPESGIDGQSDSVAFRSGDWLKYDISGLKSGAYEVSLRYASYNDALITVRLNESIVISQAKLPKTGSYTNFTTLVQTEKIYINSETKTLKIENENTESISNSSYNIDSIILKYIGDDIPGEIKLYTRNVVSGKNGEAFYCGEGYSYDYPERAAVINDKASVIMRYDYWLKYDISHIPQGEYRIALKTASMDSGRISIKINDTPVLKDSPFTASGKYTEYTVGNLGETVIIPKGNKTLTLINKYSASFNINHLCFIPVNREGNMSAVIAAQNVCGGENEGFYDNRLAGGNGAIEKTANGDIVLRGGGEWVKYDIAPFSLRKGVYDVHIKYEAEKDAVLDILKDLNITGRAIVKATCNEIRISSIHLEGNEKITIKNSGINPVILSEISLDLSEKEETFITEIDGTNVKSQVDLTKDTLLPVRVNGSDFYSANGNFEENCTDGFYVLKSGDWAVYDITGVEGMFALYLDCVMENDGKISAFLDGKLVLNEEKLYRSDENQTVRQKIGIIHLPDGTKALKILNSSEENICIRKILLSAGTVKAEEKMQGENGEAFLDVDAKDGQTQPSLSTSDFGVTLKAGEWIRYNAKGAEGAVYDVYLSGTQTRDIYLAIGKDKHFECVVNEIKTTPVYAGRLRLSDGENTIRVENTGKKEITFDRILIERVPYEAEISFEKSSASVGEKVKAKGSFESADVESVVLKIISKQGENEQVIKEETLLSNGMEVSFETETEAKGEKLSAVLCDKENPDKIYKEAELLVGNAKNIYVSSEAKDGGDGTVNKPYNSIETAKNAVRQLNKNMSGDIIVNLDGTFDIETALEFTDEDSGTGGYSIIYRGNDETTISGGKTLPKLSKVDGKEYYKTKIDFTPARQLYINGKSAKRARSENVRILSYYQETEREGKYDGFVVERKVFGNSIPDFTDMQAVFSYSWHKAFVNITDIKENEDGNYIVKCSQPEFDVSFITSEINGSAFKCYFENSPLFLDEQNEWCYISKTGEVLYYPKRFADKENLQAVMPVSSGLVKIGDEGGNGAQNIRFENISFKHGAWNEPNYSGFRVRQAEELYLPKEELDEFDDLSYHLGFVPADFSVKYGKNIHIDKCSFSLLGAVAVAFRNETVDSSIKNSVFSDISAAAINIGDLKISSDAEKEKFCRNITVENNYIENIGTHYPSSPAVSVYYANNISLIHNHVKNVPYTGFSIGWGWGRHRYNCRDIKVIGNRIEKVMQMMIDGGHIYTLSAMPGSVIRDNYMVSSGDYRGGIYFDHSSQYIFVENNVCEVADTWLTCNYAEKYSKKYNTAKNNYSWVSIVTTEPELNNFEAVKSMYIKENYENAKKIIEEAGIVT